MDATSHAVGTATAGGPEAGAASGAVPGGRARPVDPLLAYRAADFPWYGLDEGWTGRRWLMQAGSGVRAGQSAGVDYGTLGHGEEPAKQYEARDVRRFAVVVTVARRDVRRSADNTGTLEATSASSAAWLAGSGLLAATWPGQLDRALRQDWMDQQTALAWDLADDLEGPGWSALSLPVNGLPQPFRYRESEYGWVLAGEAPGVLLGAYGRGVSAYGVGFATVPDLTAYTRP
ncbi:hypothetical protein GCM10010495_19590 [Kitasatospora herbaricolor]|uniref:hypothetical protein n=1 Tax=Kitasatospora herbaricolor TaxID=68217 RepID=UPI0019916D6A|nr:hypothetical protein [Kitasatospora herbaricolor]GGV07348.1 hypothetical protein GCM10010495_19590 [Kitasatospora herbaricolor]